MAELDLEQLVDLVRVHLLVIFAVTQLREQLPVLDDLLSHPFLLALGEEHVKLLRLRLGQAQVQLATQAVCGLLLTGLLFVYLIIGDLLLYAFKVQ